MVGSLGLGRRAHVAGALDGGEGEVLLVPDLVAPDLVGHDPRGPGSQLGPELEGGTVVFLRLFFGN